METFTYGFESEGLNGNIFPTETLSHPGAVSGSKGFAVRKERRYMI
jgi:hypothetical protein